MNIDGYKVEKIETSNSVAYKLHGSRGAVIRMVRNRENPALMFAINKSGRQVAINHIEWFTDSDGSIQAAVVSKGDNQG